MDLAALSDKQCTVMAHAVSNRTLHLAEGAIRSGKTTANKMGFGIWHLHEGMDHNHAGIGQSVETFMRNLGFDLIDFYRSLGVNAQVRKDYGTRIVVPYDGKESTIWIFGADNQRSFRRIQGATLKGILLEEATILPESMWQMSWGRLSVDGSKMWATYNTEGPQHWFKKTVVDHISDFDGQVTTFLQDDNPSLSEDVKARYDKSYTGHWHRRYIRGEWAGASGLIFPTWYAREMPPKGRFTLALDWGSASVFAALGIFKLNGHSNVFAELYYDAREAVSRTEQEHFDALFAWVRTACLQDLRGTIVYLDPNTPKGFQRLLRRAGAHPRNAKAEVLPGLVSTASALHKNEVSIGDCPKLKGELGGYMWDVTASERGEDKPTKRDDHACDALRYYVHSTSAASRLIQPTTVRELGL